LNSLAFLSSINHFKNDRNIFDNQKYFKKQGLRKSGITQNAKVNPPFFIGKTHLIIVKYNLFACSYNAVKGEIATKNSCIIFCSTEKAFGLITCFFTEGITFPLHFKKTVKLNSAGSDSSFIREKIFLEISDNSKF
jgi:hypothetical protein